MTIAGPNILSPKRNKRLQTGWEGFFPYYAGFPELFAREILQSARLSCTFTGLLQGHVGIADEGQLFLFASNSVF